MTTKPVMRVTVSDKDLDRVVDGWHHDPHSILGPHAGTDSVTIRALRPLAEAVTLSKTVARKGDIVLFSPGTSSFDMFKNYADRGNQFRALVHQLS